MAFLFNGLTYEMMRIGQNMKYVLTWRALQGLETVKMTQMEPMILMFGGYSSYYGLLEEDLFSQVVPPFMVKQNIQR